MPELRIESGQNQDGLRLRIADDVSSTTMVTVLLSPEQIWDMLKGGVVRVDGVISDRLDRVGKQMINEVATFPREMLQGVVYEAQMAYAEDRTRQSHPGWDTYSARRQGGGSGVVNVVMRKWVEQ